MPSVPQCEYRRQNRPAALRFSWPVTMTAPARRFWRMRLPRLPRLPLQRYNTRLMNDFSHPPGDTHLQALIDAARDCAPRSRELLLGHACDRLLALTRRMFHGRPGLQRWEQTDDVFQNAMLRLHRALEAIDVENARHFFNLAAVQIRRELIDLGRKHFGPNGVGSNHHTDHQPGDEAGGTLHAMAAEPADLAEWTEFHQRVEALPDGEREVFDLLYYEGVSQEEAAMIMACSVRTIRRRWNDAKLRLHGGLTDGPAEP